MDIYKRPILILGSTGMLGSAVVKYFNIQGYSNIRVLPAGERVSAESTFEYITSDLVCVINALGVINRRIKSPINELEAFMINSVFPIRLAELCEKLKVKLIHVSTDCIFDGKSGLYDESFNPNPKDVYGYSKLFGEPRNAMVIRTSIIGPELNNGYSLLCWFLNNKDQQCLGFKNHKWNGLTTLELAASIEKIINRDIWRPGIQHIFSDDISKYDLLLNIKKIFHKEINIEPYQDALDRDMRLRTLNLEWLNDLGISPINRQLESLKNLCNSSGRWTL